MQNVTGQVATGDNFFDRKAEVARFWRGLQTDNLLLLAPRRVGKTSVLKHMKTQAEHHGYAAVYVDVSDCADELSFVHRLYREALEHHNSSERLWNGIRESWLGKAISRVSKAGAAGFSIEFASVESNWARLGEALAELLAGIDGQTLIEIDELPVFVLKLLNRNDLSSQGRIREFLYWMRRLRLDHPQVRWMLAGSIGLDTVASRLNIADAINDLRVETLGAFDPPTAHQFLRELGIAYAIEIPQPVLEHIQQRIGWLLPYYLQLIFNELRDIGTHGIADVDAAVNKLLDPRHKSIFDFWRQRLFDELGRPDAEYAMALLHPASRAPEGIRRQVFKQALTSAIPDPAAREDKLRYLLDVLENDGYLSEEGKLWRFHSPLLREYWLRRVAPPETEDE